MLRARMPRPHLQLKRSASVIHYYHLLSMPFPYATKAVKAWIIIKEQRPKLKHAVKLIMQSTIDGWLTSCRA